MKLRVVTSVSDRALGGRTAYQKDVEMETVCSSGQDCVSENIDTQYNRVKSVTDLVPAWAVTWRHPFLPGEREAGPYLCLNKRMRYRMPLPVRRVGQRSVLREGNAQ